MKDREVISMAVPKQDWWINTKPMIVNGFLLLGAKLDGDLIFLCFIK